MFKCFFIFVNFHKRRLERDQLHEHGVYIAEADEEEEKDGMRRKVDLRCEIDVIIERENDV